MCEDDMAEFVTWVFRFFFMVEDEAGDKLIIDCCNEGVSSLCLIPDEMCSEIYRHRFCPI